MLRKCFTILTLYVANSMTENIQHSINEIRSKALRFREEIVVLQNERTRLEQVLNDVNHSLSACKAELESVLGENHLLKTELEATKSQVVDSHPHQVRSGEEIDELVKEIEYCIGQLKK